MLLNEGNIEKRVKLLGNIFNVIGLLLIVLAVIIFITAFSHDDEGLLLSSLYVFAGGMLSMIQGYLIYALGQIIANTRK